MARKGGGRAQARLSDADVKRWYDNLARGSKATADNYLRILDRFLIANKLAPKSFVRGKAKDRDDRVFDYVTGLLDAGRAGSYVHVVKKAITSWLEWNGVRLTRRVKVPGINRRPTLQDAHIPVPEEFRRVLNLADGRSRLAIALMGHAGLRPEVLGNYEGSNGLRFRHFPEATLTNEGLSFDVMPTLIVVPEELSKTGKPYFTFLGPEGCDYLNAYVRERLEDGEVLGPDSAVITPKKVEKSFMRSLNVSDLIRKPMRAAGLKEPPYIWRSYFSSRAMLAEGRGLLRDWRQFFMGHSGDIEHVYALHKKLPPDTIEAMRKGYTAALTHLETRSDARPDEGTAKMVRTLLRAYKASEEEIAEMKLEEKTEEDLGILVAGFLDRRTRHAPASGRAATSIQEIMPYSEFKARRDEGWIFRAMLPGEDVLVERPGLAPQILDGTGTRGLGG